MRKIVLLIISACLLAAGITQAAPAEQQATPQPQIATFTSTATKVDRTALNNRTARVPVSWTTTNRPNSANLVFEQILPDGRVINVELPRENPWVASNGDGVAAPFPPGGDATSIQLRLRLIDVVKLTVYSEKTLSIPIGDVTVPTPVIRTFTSSATAVVRSELTNKTARVPVSWQVDERPNGSNLVFEQVLSNGTVVNVELPRQNPFVASSGVGIAAPVNPGDNNAATITLRLRVIDLASQKTLTQKDITIPVNNTGPAPAISVFSSTTTSVNRASLVGKTARVPVTWVALNRPNNSNLVFEQVLDNGTVVNVELPRQNPFVSSEGNGMAAPVNPGSSAVVKLQIRLIDLTTQATLAQKDLSVNITEGGTSANIAYFTTTTSVVDIATLNNRTARIPVSWSVDNRPNGSNLVFEQVLGDGSSVNVELPRQNPFVSSSGIGVTAPYAPGGTMNTVQLRLRLINLSDGATLASKDITVPINGAIPTTTYTKVTDCYQTGFPTASGIAVGGQGRVKSNVTIYSAPTNGQIAGTLVISDTFSILEGPECYAVSQPPYNPTTTRVWRVNSSSKNLTGWLPEYSQSTAGTTSFYVEVANGGPINPPQIVSFTADPLAVAPGAQVTLAWEVKNATSISISPLPASINSALANLLTGTTQVAIPTNASGTVTLQLSAKNAAGQETLASVSISIVGLPEANCPFETSLQPPTCPASQETVNAAYQPFESGYMVWNGSTKKIYVLFPDKHWEAFDDTWQAGDPDPVAEDMPANLILPINGFGKVWEQIGGGASLGFATAPEASYQTIWEMHPLADGGLSTDTPHFKLPDGRVVHLGMQWVIE
jgi:hypothetical protein